MSAPMDIIIDIFITIINIFYPNIHISVVYINKQEDWEWIAGFILFLYTAYHIHFYYKILNNPKNKNKK
jgi:hypothetical protein